MNTNGTNPGMNVDDYENIAVQKSNTAKRVAAGAALLVGGAAVAGGAAYAAGQPNVEPEDTLTAEDVVDGANAGQSFQPEEEPQQEVVTERVVYVEKPQPEETKEPTVTWDEKTVVYDEQGNVVGSVEKGTVDGKDFMLMDYDGDNHADVLAIDMDENGRFDDNEVVKYDPSDHVHMGHDTAHTREIHNGSQMPYDSEEPRYIAQNDDPTIHNNFEDEKTGERYHDDFAEDNPDYNPNADVNDYGENGRYLAENDAYDAENDGYYDAEMSDGLAENEAYEEERVEEYMAETDDEGSADDAMGDTADYVADSYDDSSYDDMVNGEEFLG